MNDNDNLQDESNDVDVIYIDPNELEIVEVDTDGPVQNSDNCPVCPDDEDFLAQIKATLQAINPFAD